MIIGISGKKGTGKDTVAKIIQYLTISRYFSKENATTEKDIDIKTVSFPKTFEEFDFQYEFYMAYFNSLTYKTVRFADSLTKIYEILTGIDYHKLTREEKEKHRPKYIELSKKIKEIFGNDIFVVVLFHSDLKSIDVQSIPNMDSPYQDSYTELTFKDRVVPDVRFISEAEIIEPSGFLIRVERPVIVEVIDGWTIKRYYNENTEEYSYSVESSSGYIDFPISNWEGHFHYSHYRVRYDNPETIPQNVKDAVHKWFLFKEDISETELDNYDFKYRLYNNGSIEELIEKIKLILIKEKVL